jgi:hypothetical protein
MDGYDVIDIINNDLEIINNFIDSSYKSDDDDIEDLYDIITIINDMVFKILNGHKNELCTDDIIKLLDCRLYGKKMVKKKYKEYKYDGRKFWNHEDAQNQYEMCTTHIWKPSVIKLSQILK